MITDRDAYVYVHTLRRTRQLPFPAVIFVAMASVSGISSGAIVRITNNLFFFFLFFAQ